MIAETWVGRKHVASTALEATEVRGCWHPSRIAARLLDDPLELLRGDRRSSAAALVTMRISCGSNCWSTLCSRLTAHGEQERRDLFRSPSGQRLAA